MYRQHFTQLEISANVETIRFRFPREIQTRVKTRRFLFCFFFFEIAFLVLVVSSTGYKRPHRRAKKPV